MCILEKLNGGELYNVQLMLSVEKLTAQTYFKKKKIQNLDLNGKILPYLDV